jgi:peptidoglycan/LPS O-acetylase OafA/YrhL
MESTVMDVPAPNNHTPSSRTAFLPALTGIRFFAVFHIFLYHLWVLYDMQKPKGFDMLMADFGQLPSGLIAFLSHGYFSTSFFFMLSGFILSYLYWGKDGALCMPKKQFWLLRAARIYPIHCITMLITIVMMWGFVVSNTGSVTTTILSAIATIALVQAWVPMWVPLWSWPTWAISALVFLYFIMPWLMQWLARCSRKTMMTLLVALPIISLIPTLIYAFITPAGVNLEQNASIFLGSTPVFWVAHFVAGMILSRLFELSRFNDITPPVNIRLAFGDFALVLVIAIACWVKAEEPLKYILRHGLLMPLFMVVIVDLARGRGLAARLFSLRLPVFLGEAAFSIFIWQNLIMTFCWISISMNPEYGHKNTLFAVLGMLVIAVFSAYCIEKPIAKKLRKSIVKK